MCFGSSFLSTRLWIWAKAWWMVKFLVAENWLCPLFQMERPAAQKWVSSDNNKQEHGKDNRWALYNYSAVERVLNTIAKINIRLETPVQMCFFTSTDLLPYWPCLVSKLVHCLNFPYYVFACSEYFAFMLPSLHGLTNVWPKHDRYH